SIEMLYSKLFVRKCTQYSSLLPPLIGCTRISYSLVSSMLVISVQVLTIGNLMVGTLAPTSVIENIYCVAVPTVLSIYTSNVQLARTLSFVGPSIFLMMRSDCFSFIWL